MTLTIAKKEIQSIDTKIDKYCKQFASTKSETAKRFAAYKTKKYILMLNFLKS